MFIVQDKETGLYHRNTTGRGGWRGGDWTDNLQDVKPFRTMAAVRNNFVGLSSILYEFSTRKYKGESLSECCANVKWNYGRGITGKCEHYKAKEIERKAAARLKYRVFRVELVLQEEQDL